MATTDERRNEFLAMIIAQMDRVKGDPNEEAYFGNVLGEANAAVREVEIWRAIEALRNQVADKVRR